MATEFRCDLSGPATPFPHFWEHTIGSGHATLALRADWQAQLRRCHDELGMRHVRFHGLLDDDMGTLVDENDALIYSFLNIDRIFDFLLSIGMRPFVELSFMPSALSSGDQIAFHYRANVTPPRDYAAWATLIRTLAAHWVERYGLEEVRQWFFEVWNEPNLTVFGTGKQSDYFALYRATATALKAVDSALRVGGPATAANEWIEDFLSFCAANQLPVDFVSTHHYPTDAFGKPGDDTEAQLAASRRSVLRDQARLARQQAGARPLYYTEWCTSSNPRDALHDEPYAAAFIVKAVMEANGLVEGYSYWTFSDIFEENYFPSIPFHGGFGLLNLYGVAKPAYRAFELLHGLGTALLAVSGEHATVDAWAVRGDGEVTLLLSNFALPRHALASEDIRLVLTGATGAPIATLRRIDAGHANAKPPWLAMGSPTYLSADAVAALDAASRLVEEPCPMDTLSDGFGVQLTLPPLSVAALRLRFPHG